MKTDYLHHRPRTCSGLNPACARFDHALKDAMAALHHLNDHNLRPLAVRMSGRKPVIRIEPPPCDSFLRGGMRMRRRTGTVMHTTMVAPFHGCQVEWEVETRAPARPIRS